MVSWENYGKDGWHIDHFVPINAFDLREKDNIKKSDIIPMGWDGFDDI